MARNILMTEEFRGWHRYCDFLSGYLDLEGETSVLDIGGGANPMLGQLDAPRMAYDLLDIDADELQKAKGRYSNLFCGDAAMATDAFVAALRHRTYDLVFSHMFLEHVQNPDQVHRNIFAVLKPGGHAIHAYPTNNNIPLAVNSMLPEAVSAGLLRHIQPARDFDGQNGKFPAYYRRCYAPSERATRYFETFGYEVAEHWGYAGHGYYRRIPLLRSMEKVHRRVVVALQLRWVVFNLVVLRKPLEATSEARVAVAEAV